MAENISVDVSRSDGTGPPEPAPRTRNTCPDCNSHYREDEMVGRVVWEIIVMQDASRRAIEQKLKGERELRPFVRSFKKADGTAIPLLLADRHIRDVRGEIVGLRTAMTEIKPDA